MKKRVFVIVIVIIMLLLMAAPVMASVKLPKDNQGKQFQDLWNALDDLQNQIFTLTQRVDNIKTIPMPNYRAGTITTPSEGDIRSQMVTFSSPMPNTNYRVIITNADTTPILGNTPGYSGLDGILTIDSRTTTGFTFSYRYSSFGASPMVIANSHTFDYIAIADN